MTSVYCPEMHCFCADGVYKQPNMRLFSLNEHDEWTLWRSNSDYFYPEMIPEPDYSDSGEDAGSEDEEYLSFGTNSRPGTERLRDLTEVYVSNADVKIKAASTKMSTNKQASTSRKAATGEKVERQPRKMSPKTLPKGPRKTRSKSPTKASKSASPTAKPTVKTQESGKKTPVKTKLPPSKLIATVSTTTKRTKSPESAKKMPARPKSPESAKKIPARPKSPTKASDTKSATARKTRSPEGVKRVPIKKKSPIMQAEAAEILKTTKEKTGDTPSAVTKREAGDAPKIKTDISPLSSPGTDESKSGISSPISTENSSDDDLIKPKKPYQLSTEKQKLHKELKFSQRYGKLVSPKTELQLAIERFTENKEKKELEVGEKTSLEKILEVQARKIKMQEATDKSPSWMDHLQRPPVTSHNPKADEFYRVHARVVNSSSLTQCFLPDDDLYECSSSQTLTQTESGSDS